MPRVERERRRKEMEEIVKERQIERQTDTQIDIYREGRFKKMKNIAREIERERGRNRKRKRGCKQMEEKAENERKRLIIDG